MQADLTIRVAGDLSAIRASLTGLRSDIKAVNDATQDLKNRAPKGDELAKGWERAGAAVGGFLASLVSVAAFKGFVDIADDMQSLNARLKLATDSTAAFAEAQADVARIANTTRSDLLAIGDLYTKLMRSSENLGTTQKQTADITQAVAEALKISGASAEESSAAILQLSQAFGSGVLQGDEFRSLAEAAPRLLQAIAKGMDVPIGALKQLGSEGKLTAAAVAEALLKTKTDLDREFAAIPSTVGDALTKVHNSIDTLVDDSNRSSGATQTLVDALNDLSTELNSPEFKAGFAAFIAGLVTVAQKGAEALTTVSNLTKFAAEEVASRVNGAANDDIVRIQEQLDRETEKLKNTAVLPQLLGINTKAYDDQARVVTNLVTQLDRAQKAADAFAKTKAPATPGAAAGPGDLTNVKDNAALNATKNLTSTLNKQLDTLKEQAATYGKGKEALVEYQKEQQLATAATITDTAKRQQAIDNINKAYDPLLKQAKALDAVTKAQKDNNKAQAIDPAARAEATRAALAAQLKASDALYQNGKVSIRDYYNTKASLEQQDIDAQIKQQQAQADTTKSLVERGNAEAKIAQLQQQRAAIGPAVAEEQRKAEEALGLAIRGVVEQYLELNNQMGVATRLQLEDQYKELRQRLQTEGDTSGVALIDKVIDTKATRAQLQQLETDFQTTLQNLQAQEQTYTNQVTTGSLTQIEAQQKINDLRAQALPTLQQNLNAVKELADATADPKAAAAVTQLTNQLQVATQQTSVLGDAFKSGLTNGLTQALDGLINRTETLGQAARQVFESILNALAQVAIQALATKAATALTNLFGGGGDQAGDLSAGAAKVATSSAVLGAASGLLGLNAEKLQQAANTLLIASAVSTAATVAHGGAMAGTSGMTRQGVPAWVFAGAPRYHVGGVAGLKPGEVPAVLQTGERVLSRTETAAYNGRGGGTPSIRIVNAIDENFVRDNIGSAETEIMNIVRKNDRSGSV